MEFIKYKDSQYGEGIQLEEYQGTLNLVAAQMGKDGVVYSKWCYPQGIGKGAGPIEKALPWKIKLGSKKEAVSILTSLIHLIAPEDVNLGEDCPF